jgi:hypothetical protein
MLNIAPKVSRRDNNSPTYIIWAELREVTEGHCKKVVRAVGIEPTLLSELDFESSASTSFTTPARTSEMTQGALFAAPSVSGQAHAAFASVETRLWAENP